MSKMEKLRTILRSMDSALLAFSGGVDSTFLLKVAHDVLGDRLLAVTANSPTYPPEELHAAQHLAKKYGVRHMVITTHELANRRFRSNPADRCYYCKKELFGRLMLLAKKKKMAYVMDASNVTDHADIRPGARAKKEYGVRSPLDEAGFTKEDIRRISKQLGLPTGDKPALACLASRIPYQTPITRKTLQQVHAAEQYLRRLHVGQLRVRHHGDLCRIEVDSAYLPVMIRRRVAIITRFKKIGFTYITLDIEGYRTGSMNESLPFILHR